MLHINHFIFKPRASKSLWENPDPIRSELFGIERLEEHAASLAVAQEISLSAPRVLPLNQRLNDNARSLLVSYRDSAADLEAGLSVVPAAEWLLDNYHLVEEQVREVRNDLPARFYRQLPKLSTGPLAGFPRVFGVAWAFIAHTDSHIDPENLVRFIRAYQKIQPLKIGELWAVSITLRIVLIENLRRLADQIEQGRKERADADKLIERLMVSDNAYSDLHEHITPRLPGFLSEDFAAHLAKRLRNLDTKTTPVLEWLEQRLEHEGLSVEQVVQHAQQRQGASNVSIRNVITSMRLISDIDWTELFEKVSLVDQVFSQYPLFKDMDIPTRNLYRSAVEILSRGSHFSEIEIAEKAIKVAQASQVDDTLKTQDNRVDLSQVDAKTIEQQRLSDPGYYLIDQGRRSFEQTIHYHPTLRLRIRRGYAKFDVFGYSASIVFFALGFLALTMFIPGFEFISWHLWLLWLVVAFIPITDVASAVVNRLITKGLGATLLPGLDLKNKVPTSLRTLIVIPTLLSSKEDLLEQIEQLEVHYLTGIEGDVSFALLTDGVDANEKELASDAALLKLAKAEISRLNHRYCTSSSSPRFLLLHRHRLFNPQENIWMGWERKRGKLRELNRLLRGATDTSFVNINGRPPWVPGDVRYVITLDSDTRLRREAALRLIGKMAHPLNRPRFDKVQQRVVAGYGILQPRVTPSLSVGTEGSMFQRIFSSPGGIDPYAAAISDVYQDLFGEGTFTGKGIYDVDMFEAALADRVSCNTMLSHDLFEGIFARAGLVSDVEVVEEFPSRYDVASKRDHRWIRGDWQLLPWLVKRKSNQGAPALGRWKLFDNLRRSLVAPLTLTALLLSWILLPSIAYYLSLLLLATIAIPPLIPSFFSVVPNHKDLDIALHLRLWIGDLRLALTQTFLTVAFLPDQSWRSLDAIGRTLFRLWISHRHCLEWSTAAHSSASPKLKLIGFYKNMAWGTLLGLCICLGAEAVNPVLWPLIIPMAILWGLAPILAYWVSQSPRSITQETTNTLSNSLRLTARQTWRFFETFVTSEENQLPPDNFQEAPDPIVAHRTSPTNIGLYLLSAVAAYDFGWSGLLATIARLEKTIATLETLPKYRGHLFNWYDTKTLDALLPKYISSVDSGNLAGHLITLANSCDELRKEQGLNHQKVETTVRSGFIDNVDLARQNMISNLAHKNMASDSNETAKTSSKHPLIALLDEIDTVLSSEQIIEAVSPILIRLTDKAAMLAQQEATDLTDEVNHGNLADFIFWILAAKNVLVEYQQDSLMHRNSPNSVSARLELLATNARKLALAMEFGFLIEPERKLLSIGYALSENRLDSSCYDLLASEARLASLFAIAKGDVETKHWFRLGRSVTPIGTGTALISWSGSMFEYLMPSLVMRAPLGSLLEQTNRLIVDRQQDYGRQLGIPWGVSESAYNARDIEFTYQYSNFGVPGLGLKRGLAENKVIAPYATALSAMIDPRAAIQNYKRLDNMGARGRYGFYEALDFTPSRLAVNSNVAIVHCFMAHHQGMTIVAIANTLHEGSFRRRFHREPIIQACELLLQERMPRDVSISYPLSEAAKILTSPAQEVAPTVRHLYPNTDGTPITHLLSNGRYAVMLTASGGGYSRWRDIAVTRWKEDTTCDRYGSYLLLRDTKNGHLWSPTAQPLGGKEHYPAGIFEEDHAEFMHHEGSLTTTMDVIVSGEDDSEVRRLSLRNNGHRVRDIELTSYLELVLTRPETDNAHPAFAKLFVETEYVAEYSALVATRRKRSEDDVSVWAAHFAIVEGEVISDLQYETDRALFIGRGHSISNAAAFHHETDLKTDSDRASPPLSNTVGTVLDPIFSLRSRVRVPVGHVVRVAFWTVVASSRSELIELIDRHHDRSAYDRAKTLAWTQAQVQLRHFEISSAMAADFQRLTAPILYADPRFRAAPESIQHGITSQSVLWPHGIGGDLPIVLLRIDDIEDINQVKQILCAHEYWRMKQLSVDLVIINEHAYSYMQDLQVAIENAIRSCQSRPRLADKFRSDHINGSVYLLRADLLDTRAHDLLASIARVVLVARHGTIAQHIDKLPPVKLISYHPKPKAILKAMKAVSEQPVETESAQKELSLLKQNLEFFNGLGGFSQDGREYTVILENGAQTPAPWINVIANERFGFQVAAEGSSYTWAENSRENQLTSWCNDPVSNPSGEAIYVRDEDTLELFSATAAPLNSGNKNSGAFVAHHGHGYSRFEHRVSGLALSLLQYVPLEDPIKISRLTIHNQSKRQRKLSVTSYLEWVLGTDRGATGPFLTVDLDEESKALFVSNQWNVAFPNRIAFSDMSGRQSAWTVDRTEFLGRNGGMNAPIALITGTSLSGTREAGRDPCTVQQCFINLKPNESVDVVILMGQCASADIARSLITQYRGADLDLILNQVTRHWATLLGAVQVKTPDRAMDIMLNGWLLYQTVACRMWARSAFYQASGAYGFRDQLQDGMSLTFRRPDLTRAHILRAASRQFVEGDVQHWWLPHSGQGVRTRISDDRVWLAFATATYIETSGDMSILDEQVTFIDGPMLTHEQHDAYFHPMESNESASLFEHCARGLDQCIDLTGKSGLPLMGTGDWNDGMNRVGEGGQGESVWLGWLLIRTINLFSPLAKGRHEHERNERWINHAQIVKQAIEDKAWDGEWYRRANFDDGSWLGSKDNDECQIDSIAQSWAVLSGAAEPRRAAKAMDSLSKRLILPNQQLALLFTPPFDKTLHDPGYIKGYPPGLRENGGQYSHAAMWTILAFAKLGDADKARDLFALLNPINHARNTEEAERYKVEPYVMSADVYSVAPHIGRGGWTWYTGSAGWMNQAGMEGILGIHREAQTLLIEPCIPSDWPGFEATIKIEKTEYFIEVNQVKEASNHKYLAVLDGVELKTTGNNVQVPLNGGVHKLSIMKYV